MRNKRLGIWGWWQGNNLGDNWIKRVLAIYFPCAEFIETSVEDFSVYDFVICGGGGLFIYDVISPWNNLSAKRMSKFAFGMLGLGAEFPHETNKAKFLAEKAKFFYVRDQYSLECMHLPDIEQSYDITFLNPLPVVDIDNINSNKLFFVWRDGKELLENEKFYDYIKTGSSYQDWKGIIKDNFREIVEDDFQTRDDNIEERIGDCGFVISGRYHGIVAAIQAGLPFVAIDICPKIRALLRECDLEEYCIKISEVNNLEKLIRLAKKNLREIRYKEQVYVNKANQILLKQIENVRLEILKTFYPLNIIHYGSYWMGDNDVVNTMADDLSDCCNLKKIDLKAYSSKRSKRIFSDVNTPNGKVCILDGKRVLRDIKKYRANAIILNSGGLTLSDEMFETLKQNEVTTIGISLSDPDVFPYNGKVYADKFDLFYTNAKYSFNKQYDKTKVNIRLLPFAASTKHHYFMPKVERKYDVVVVGHAREERLRIVEQLEEICKVGTYGNGWNSSLGTVNGDKHIEAINSGNMYLSFSQTVAGFNNVKVGLFEAMACNQVVITSYMDELQDYFKIGEEILCYKDEEELINLIKYYMVHVEERERVRQAGYQRFLRDHTYVKRWENVLRELYIKEGLYNKCYANKGDIV